MRWRAGPCHTSLTVRALNLGLLPLSVSFTANHRQVALREAWVALVADDGVDGVLFPPVTEHVCVLHLRWGATGHWGQSAQRQTLLLLTRVSCGGNFKAA